MQVAIGTDLIEIQRIRSALQKFGERFLQRVFTPEELEQGNNNIQRLAGYYAAKEATAKLLGTGIGQVSWQDIEVTKLKTGKPRIILYRKAAEISAAQKTVSMDVSITHTETQALATVVALRNTY